MSQISVTLSFANQAELVAFFTGKTAPAQPIVASLPGEGLKQTEKAATKTVAKPHPEKAEAPNTGKPVAGASEQAGTDASTASDDVPYATLQKAVFALANKNRDAVMAVAKSLGVDNFKGFEQNAEGRPAALKAVNAKLAELEVA